MSEVRRLPRRLRAFPSAGLDECLESKRACRGGQATAGTTEPFREAVAGSIHISLQLSERFGVFSLSGPHVAVQRGKNEEDL